MEKVTLRWSALLNKLFIVKDLEQRDNLLDNILRPDGYPKTIAFLNAYAMMISLRDNEFFKRLSGATYLLRDGIGVKYLLSSIGLDSGLNLNGSDLIPEIISLIPKESRVALMGTNDMALDLVNEKLSIDGFSNVTTLDGSRADEDYLNHVQENNPTLVVLGMGMPKQERVAELIASKFPDRDLVILFGGGILDFLSGLKKRAPLPIRKYNLEWLYRFSKEPRRMWARNIESFIFIVYTKMYAKRIRKLVSKVQID